MAYTSPTTINASNGLTEFMPYLNEVTNGFFGLGVMLVIYIMFLFGVYRAKEDFVGAFAIAGYASFVIGLIFWVIGLINGVVFSMIIGLAVISTIILLMRD